LDGRGAGGAGGDELVEGLGAEKVQVMAHQPVERLGIAAGEGRDAAAALVRGQIHPHPMVVENLEDGLPHLGEA